MDEILYTVKDNDARVVARDLNLDNAMIFVRALFNTYFNEDGISYTTERQ